MNVSVNIGTQSLDIVQGEQKGSTILVQNAVKIKTQTGLLKDGHISDVSSLSENLKQAFKTNKIKGTTLTLVVNSSSIITRAMTVPKANDQQIVKFIQSEMFQADDAQNDYIIDYMITEQTKEGKVVHYQILAIAIPNQLLEGYISLGDKLGFSKVIIDAHFNTIYKTIAIQSKKTTDDKPVIIGNIGTTSGIFMIIENGKIVFSKSIRLNASKYVKLTSDTKTIDYAKLDFSSDQKDEVRKLAEMFVYDIAQEISKIIQFQYSRNSAGVIEDVFISGALTQANRVERHLSSILDAPVKIITKPFCVKTKMQLQYGQFVAAVGGLIRMK